MDTILQLWGGGLYLLNKILFSLSESKSEDTKNQLKKYAWSACIIGAPAWLVILVDKNDWIVVSIEIVGIPAMLLGLYKAHFRRQAHLSIEKAIKYSTYGAIIVGFSFSLKYHGGITSLSQLLEIGGIIGFLMGNYLMTQNNRNGYLFFMLMNICIGLLMGLQEKHILMVQQTLSLSFVIYGYTQSTKV